MPVNTPWGYSIEEQLPPLISLDQLADATQGRFGPDTIGAKSAVDGVSAAIRAFCGWHVAPAATVTERTSGPGRVIALSSMMVGSVESVAENGVELGEGQYEYDQRGLIRRAGWRCWPDGYGSVVVRYVSGFDLSAVPDVATVAAQVAANALAAPAGVRSEQAGDVSITYNQTGTGISGGIRLLDSDMAMLAPYALDRTWS